MSAPGPPPEQAQNPIPMTQEQLSNLLEEIARLDTGRVILEPGVQLGENGYILNLETIRAKVPDPNYTLPEMLTDLNSICEPFLNQGPEHAQYAKQFLEQANESIMIAVRDAQALAIQQQQHMHQQATAMHPSMHEISHNGLPAEGSVYQTGPIMHDTGNGERDTWLAQVVGEEGVGEGGGMAGHAVVPVQGNGSMMANHHYEDERRMMQKKAENDQSKSVAKPKPTQPARKLDAPRPRVEGRRCEVCAVIKKAGCGTDAAHFRCLKRKKPESTLELEKKVEELGDMGEEERVTVWNPKEGRKLSGQAAPMLKNLAGWLANHPGWEAHPKGNASTVKKKKEELPEQPS